MSCQTDEAVWHWIEAVADLLESITPLVEHPWGREAIERAARELRTAIKHLEKANAL